MGAPRVPLRWQRNELVTLDQAERVYGLGLKLLAKTGMEVLDEPVLARLQALGFRARGKRVLLEPAVVEEHVTELRRRKQAEHAGGDRTAEPLTLSISQYPHHLHHPATGQVLPYTTAALIEMTRLVDSFAGEGVRGTMPGYPMDVPGPLQQIAQYRIAAENHRDGCEPTDLTTASTAPFFFEMAEALGRPVTGLPVYLVTPLKVGGESLDLVLQNAHRLDHIWVASMPAAGTTAPISPLAAYVVSVAEHLGGMVLLHALTGLPVSCHASIFPADMRSLAMVFGSPENLLFHLGGRDLNRILGFGPEHTDGNVHCMAKLPGAQAAAEKAAIMMAGALAGARHFTGAGTLALDEVFSPEQLVLDCEIRDWVQRAVAGLDVVMPDEDVLGEVEAALTEGFLGQVGTVAGCRRFYWHPRFFERDLLGAWQAAGSPELCAAVGIDIAHRIARHNYQLGSLAQREIERIYRAAAAFVAAM